VSSRKTTGNQFPGLELSAEDRAALKTLSRKRLSARVWRRVRILQLLDRGWTMADAADAAGTYPREVRRVGWRFLKGGLVEALGEDARPKQARMLDARQEAAIVAMVCAPPPPGRSRWTALLVAQEATRRKIVAKVGRETIRRMLTRHELKPWREKNVVRPEGGSGVPEADGERARSARKTSE
jgi:Homeodomain-like domain